MQLLLWTPNVLQKWPEQQLHSQSKLCSLITEWGTDVMESCKLQTIVTTTVPGMQWPCFTFYIYSFLLWWPCSSLGSWLLCIMTAITRCQTGSQTCTPPFFSTLRVMLANLFCLSSVSSRRPEITLHRHLWKILFIKSWKQMRMKAKAWRQSFTYTVVSGTLKASANIYTLLVPITWVDISPGKEPQLAPWYFP